MLPSFSSLPAHLKAVIEPLCMEAEQRGYARGKADGQTELLCGIKAVQQLISPVAHPPLPLSMTAAMPVNLSQPAPQPSEFEQATEGDESEGFDFDAILDGLFDGQWSDAEKQEILGIAIVAVREAADAQGVDPEPFVERLKALASNPKAAERVMMGHPVWLAWVPERIDNPRGKYQYRARDTDTGRVVYGAEAERKLRKDHAGGEGVPSADDVTRENKEYLDARTKARENVDAVTQKLAQGQMLKPQEWDEFHDQLSYLTGQQLKDVRKTMMDRLASKVKGGKRKGDRIGNLQSAIKSVVQFGVTRSFQEDYDRLGGESLADVVKQYGGIDPDDHEFQRHFGSASEAREYGVATKKGGKSLDDLAKNLVSAGHLVVPEGVDQTQALVDALQGKKKAATADDGQFWDERYKQHAAQQELDAVDTEPQPADEPIGEQSVEGGDASFDFGANAEPAPEMEAEPVVEEQPTAEPEPEPAEVTVEASDEEQPVAEDKSPEELERMKRASDFIKQMTSENGLAPVITSIMEELSRSGATGEAAKLASVLESIESSEQLAQQQPAEPVSAQPAPVDAAQEQPVAEVAPDESLPIGNNLTDAPTTEPTPEVADATPEVADAAPEATAEPEPTPVAPPKLTPEQVTARDKAMTDAVNAAQRKAPGGRLSPDQRAKVRADAKAKYESSLGQPAPQTEAKSVSAADAERDQRAKMESSRFIPKEGAFGTRNNFDPETKEPFKDRVQAADGKWYLTDEVDEVKPEESANANPEKKKDGLRYGDDNAEVNTQSALQDAVDAGEDIDADTYAVIAQMTGTSVARVKEMHEDLVSTVAEDKVRELLSGGGKLDAETKKRIAAELKVTPAKVTAAHSRVKEQDAFIDLQDLKAADSINPAGLKAVAKKHGLTEDKVRQILGQLENSAQLGDPDNDPAPTKGGKAASTEPKQAPKKGKAEPALKAPAKAKGKPDQTPAVSVTPDEKENLRLYSQASASINALLRQGEMPIGREEKAAIAAMDAVADRSKTKSPMTVFRGYGPSYLKGIADQIGVAITDPSAVGRSFTDNGFVSTTDSQEVANERFVAGDEDRGMVRIEVPPGTPAINMNAVDGSASANENEHVLGRGLKFTVVGNEGGVPVLRVEPNVSTSDTGAKPGDTAPTPPSTPPQPAPPTTPAKPTASPAKPLTEMTEAELEAELKRRKSAKAKPKAATELPAKHVPLRDDVKALAAKATSDPGSVSDEEIESILSKVENAGMSEAEAKQFAFDVTGVKESTKRKAILALRGKLTAAKRILEGRKS